MQYNNEYIPIEIHLEKILKEYNGILVPGGFQRQLTFIIVYKNVIYCKMTFL